MTRCIGKKALWELSEGGGSEAERAHLETCEACQRHYQHLIRDLELIGQVLQEPEPRLRTGSSPGMLPRRWIPAAALAATCLLVWGVSLVWEPVKLVWFAYHDKETVRTAQMIEQQLLPALFSTVAEVGLGALPEQASDLDYLQAALDGGWPCERSGIEQTDSCGRNLSSLGLDGTQD